MRRRVGAAQREEPSPVGLRLHDGRVLRAHDAGAAADPREDEGGHADREGRRHRRDPQPETTGSAADGERQVQHPEAGGGRAEEKPQRVFRERRARLRSERRHQAPEPRGQVGGGRLLPRRPEDRALRHLHRERQQEQRRERHVRAAPPGQHGQGQDDRRGDQVVRVDDAREVERRDERRAPRGQGPLRVPVPKLRAQEQEAQRHEEHVEDREREVVPQAGHPAEVQEEVREAEPGRSPERVVVPAGQPDVVDHDVAPERPEVQGRDRGDDGHEDRRRRRRGPEQAPPRRGAREVAEGAGPAQRHEEKRREGPGQLLGGAGEAEEEAGGDRPRLPGEEDRAQDHGHEHEVVRAEDLVPVDERVERRDPRRAEPPLDRDREADGEGDDQRVEEEGDDTRVEAPEQGAARQVERQHDEVRARQVRVVAQDRVAPELVPEARHPRLAGEDRARVVGAVGALAREDLVDRERQLDDAPVLAVGPVRRRAQADEGGARKDDQEDGAEADDAGARRGPRARGGEQGVGEGEERRQRRRGGAPRGRGRAPRRERAGAAPASPRPPPRAGRG